MPPTKRKQSSGSKLLLNDILKIDCISMSPTIKKARRTLNDLSKNFIYKTQKFTIYFLAYVYLWN